MATVMDKLGALGDAILPNRRRSPRGIVEVAAQVVSSRGERAGMTIANISVHGCSIAGNAPWLRLGGFVSVDLRGGQSMQGIVRWLRDGTAGLEFLRPVPAGHGDWHELINSIAEM